MPFNFEKLEIPEIILVKPRIIKDERGFFIETYKYSDFAAGGIKEIFVQDNHSRSSKHTLRGLHFQKNPHAQGKLVRCIRGEIFDVAVDVRRGSPSFGKWVSTYLSEENGHMLYVPVGFAHGFLTMTDGVEVQYKCTSEYAPQEDRGIAWDDKTVGVKWPITNPFLSAKDQKHPGLLDADSNFEYNTLL